MTSFERALFEIAEELIRPYDLVPSYAPDYAEMWREVEAYDIPTDYVPTEDDLWRERGYEEYCAEYDAVESEILAFREYGLPVPDDSEVCTVKNRARGVRRDRTRHAKNRRINVMVSIGYDPDYDKIKYGRRVSELIHHTPAWRKYWESPKIARRNPNLSGKGSAYKKVRGWWD